MTLTLTVPDTLDEALTPEWLTAALELQFPGVRVTEVVRGPVVSRLSTNARFHITTSGPLPDGLSADLCIKGYFDEPAARSAGVSEICFYRDLAARVGVRTLRSVFAVLDSRTNHGAVITEDVAVQGAQFLDGTSSYTADHVAESLAQLAQLHAATWCAADLAAVPWLAPRMEQTLASRGVREIALNFDGPNGAGIPPGVRDAQRLVDAYRGLAAEVRNTAEWTVMHGDPHIGNVYLDGSGRPCFLDWQVVQRGAWWVDVGYHIASALSVEDRRRHEADLLRHYLSELQARGTTPPSWDDAWLGMQRGLIHGLFLWGISMRVAADVTASLLHRLGTAADDHGSFDQFLR